MLALCALLAPALGAAATRDVAISGSQFSPRRTIAISGDVVRWTNHDFTPHNVTSDAFASGSLGRGGTFEAIFASPGSFSYYCSIHFGMTGSVGVYDVYLAPLAGSLLSGRTVTLTGLARAGEEVTLQRVSDATSLGTTTAAADGRFAFTVTARGPSFAVRATEGPSVSAPPVTVAVRPKVAIGARKLRRGHLVSVVAAPAQHGAALVVERAGSFGWRRLVRGTLNAASKASLRVSVSGTARIRARVTRAVGGYAPGVSGTIRIRG